MKAFQTQTQLNQGVFFLCCQSLWLLTWQTEAQVQSSHICKMPFVDFETFCLFVSLFQGLLVEPKIMTDRRKKCHC